MSDHNHPEPETEDERFSGLPAAVVDRAKEAKCSRCKIQVVESPAIRGTVMVSYYVPALGQRRRGVLCGACGIAFREFLMPELLDNPAYQQVAARLRQEWV